ncbi:DNA mismatch repair protein MSH3 [Macrolepiota fuliginosa MF-IS2]|uniref:DNA mismatch repair protein MSH3 n=1 Tax=Macrolepiota fuliginosa MF-IS2 TaxID=1400762 RepID=A0A9P5XKU3_9AGAR|nr:DNA mismatch repair protein MSH3 [Macrolepiota fuliginosa MF-IS2]
MPAPTGSQTRLSSYFSPSPTKSTKRRERSASLIDLTSDVEENEPGVYTDEPPIKKIKVVRQSQSQSQSQASSSFTTKSKKPSGAATYTQSILFSQTSTPPRPNLSTQGQSTGIAERWAFVPQGSPSRGSPSDPAIGAKVFKKTLSTNDSRFRLRPGALGPPGTLTEGAQGRGTPIPEDGNVAEDSGDDSDAAFREVMDMFSHPSSATVTGKGKQRASTETSKKPPLKIGPSGEAYTPLELQVLKLKEDNPGTLLLIEVGYRYKFFGDDAKTAADELGMVAYDDRNFLVASIPTDRLNVHLKKLLARGYRVGVVNQAETAALKKASENRNAPFDRKLTHLYTAATFVDDLESEDTLESYSPPPFMCLVEETRKGNANDVSVAMVTICPSTGDVVWDDFEDSLMRIELETRLVHTRPAEMLLPESGMSDSTTKMLRHFTGDSAIGCQIRTEYIKTLMSYSDAFSAVSSFYTDKKRAVAASDSFKSGKLIAEITDFPKRVVIALAHAIKYLSKFNIADALLETKFFTKFTTRAHMLLAANTLINLEVYRNETDYTTRGSLMQILNKTQTKFGARLLKTWVGRPLVDRNLLQERINAVQEIFESGSDKLMRLRGTLARLPDLARGLCRIQYGQCTPKELANILKAFKKIGNAYAEEFENPSDVGLDSCILNGIIFCLPKLRPVMQELIGAVNLDYADENRKELMWTDPDKYPGIMDAAIALKTAEVELVDELKAIRKQLRMPSLQWTSHLNDEYLIEVKKDNSPPIPDSWVMHSRTKFLVRYQPPTVRTKVETRARFQEMLEAESQKAYQEFLKEISDEYYGVLRDAVNKLAVADCLSSLARVALEENYVKPEFTDEGSLEIIEARHPMIEKLLDCPFIPNSVTMGFGQPRSKIITGPNMGGKSSFVRTVALIVLMAQIGSYVPAQSVKMGLHDAILTRMGASDDLAKGRSTFMVEMSETSDILHTATSRSLVILDELGRGTSTFDGMAIADATLRQLVNKTRSKTLFITHYPLIASGIERMYPQDVENIHMGFVSDTRIDGTRNITFLYKVEPGITTESFGVECARLAGMPEPLLEVAARHAQEFQHTTEERIKQNRFVTHGNHKCGTNRWDKDHKGCQTLEQV